MDEPSATLLASAPEDELLPLCGTLHAGNCVRDDDFTGGGGNIEDAQPIPEPGTSVLVALGLTALGLHRRGLRRAAPR
jgi:hypothetical protein